MLKVDLGALLPSVRAMLDWARSRHIGFSHLVSLGEHADVDFGDMLDFLGSDAKTRAILLYIESVEAPRKFMSAARAAARNKPVIVVKSGRSAQGQRAAASHTGALAGSDIVYDAAIARAGMLRVDTMQQLFLAAETLAPNAMRWDEDQQLWHLHIKEDDSEVTCRFVITAIGLLSIPTPPRLPGIEHQRRRRRRRRLGRGTGDKRRRNKTG